MARSLRRSCNLLEECLILTLKRIGPGLILQNDHHSPLNPPTSLNISSTEMTQFGLSQSFAGGLRPEGNGNDQSEVTGIHPGVTSVVIQ